MNQAEVVGSARGRLTLMMVLEFFIWGAWLPLIFGYLPSLGFTPAQQSWILNAFPIAAIVGVTLERDQLELGLRPAPDEVLPELSARLGLAFVLQGSVWLFMAISAVVVSYRVPLDRLTKAILVGYTPYLLVFTVGSSVSAALGWEQARALQFHPPVYVALLAYWNHVAWTHGEGRERPPLSPGFA